MNRTLKNVSKAFALVLALVMVLGVAIPAFAAYEDPAKDAKELPEEYFVKFAYESNGAIINNQEDLEKEIIDVKIKFYDKETGAHVGDFEVIPVNDGRLHYEDLKDEFDPEKHTVRLFYWTSEMDQALEGQEVVLTENNQVVYPKFPHDVKAKNIQVLGGPENAGLEDVDFEITVKDKNGDVVDTFTNTVGSTDKHGFYDWGQHVEVDEEGISPAEAEKKGVAPENGVVLVDGVAIPVGGTIEFKPVESTLPEGFVYNKDLKLVINPWERHTNYLRQGEVDGTVEPDNADLYIYTAELPEIANPYVINYNYDQVRVIVKVFTRGDKYTEEMPVVDSTINVYTADWDETGRVKEGKLVDTVKTDKNGFAEFMLDKSELVKVFNANGFTEIEVPYVLKQVDGGSDLNVVPYDGLIWATGDYNWAGLKLGASEDAEFEFTVNDLGEDTLKITIRNTRDAVNEVVEEDIFTQAVELAKKQFETGLVKGNDEYKDVVIATVEEAKLADALTAGSVAALYDAPLLLVEEDKLPEVVAEYIEEAKAERAIVIGGPNTVSDEVVTELEKIAGTVFRISGSNRWETATEVAKRVQKEFGQDTVLLANGEGNDKFIDSLAVAAVSAEYGYPVVLTAGDFLPAETADFLGSFDVETVHVIGGEHSVAESVVRAVNAELKSGTTIDRVAGENRFETAVAIADKFFADAETAVFVNGDKNDLALLAGPYAAANNAPVILVGEDVPESVQKYLPESKISKAILVGETPEEVRLEIAELIREY